MSEKALSIHLQTPLPAFPIVIFSVKADIRYPRIAPSTSIKHLYSQFIAVHPDDFKKVQHILSFLVFNIKLRFAITDNETFFNSHF